MKAAIKRGKSSKKPKLPPRDDWESLCKSLVKERDAFLLELERLRTENKMLKYNLYALLSTPLPYDIHDKKKMLARAVFEPSLDDFIDELRQEVAANGSRK